VESGNATSTWDAYDDDEMVEEKTSIDANNAYVDYPFQNLGTLENKTMWTKTDKLEVISEDHANASIDSKADDFPEEKEIYIETKESELYLTNYFSNSSQLSMSDIDFRLLLKSNSGYDELVL
jgi:hypothetical protein